jgi:flagellar motor switch protein FliN/FliY
MENEILTNTGMAVGKNEESLAQVPSNNIDLLLDVSMRVTVELGRTRMPLSQILELQHGSVVELDRLAGDPVDIFVNDCMIARGEVVIVDDKFGVRITEMVSPRNGRAVA